MEAFFLHLIKSSALLTIFFLAYRIFLSQDKSFVNNRIFLAAGIIFSFTLPFIYFTRKIVQEHIPIFSPAMEVEKTVAYIPAESGIDVWQVIALIYFFIAVLLLIRIFRQIFMVLKLVIIHPGNKSGIFIFINTSANIAPFSFFNIIVFNSSIHKKEELKMILEHEKVHARQYHSLDILLSNFLTTILWFFPLSWYYRKLVEQNLEFIADCETLKVIENKKEYQYALLRVSQVGINTFLFNYFRHSYIINRIQMLGKTSDRNNNNWKPFIVLPLVLFFLYSFNVKEKIEYKEEVSGLTSVIIQEEPIFYIDKTTSDNYIDQMVTYFSENYPQLHIAVTGVSRNKDNQLTGFELRTKFKGEIEFHIRLENKGKDELKPRFSLQYSPEMPSLIVKEKGVEELEIKITKEEMIFSRPIIPITRAAEPK